MEREMERLPYGRWYPAPGSSRRIAVMPTRRYDDDEVREIFALATTSPSPDRSLTVEPGGLTLGDLQRIGQEAGIDPSLVAAAAATLEARGRAAPVRKGFGMPIGVSRVVELPRTPTDREWEQLVSICRTTFGARGRVTGSGGLREWSQGNLHVCVEPTARGYQLRMATVKGDAMPLNWIGLLMTGMTIVLGTVGAIAGDPLQAPVAVGPFGGIAAGAFGLNALRLPRWARERERQMGSIAEQAVALLREPLAHE